MAAPPSRRSLSLVLVLAGLVSAAIVIIVLGPLGGWDYYRTPLAARGYLPAHAALRPSGTVGIWLGVAGAAAMISTLPYAARKHIRLLARLGSLPRWLEFHIFFGLVGPVLVTLHTAFKFNGIVAVGYWLMAAVWASGFVGRYLYVRIPRTIRGVELSRAEVEAEMAGAGEWGAASHAARHAMLVKRLDRLERTRRLFALWHVFHQPLVYVMFLIVGLHVAVAVYLGYARVIAEALR